MAGSRHDNHSDQASDLTPVDTEWGEKPDDHFGYASEEVRRASRGLEDWEMVEQMSEPELNIMKWFRTVIGSIVLGIIIFIILAYGVYFFLTHYGSHFFA